MHRMWSVKKYQRGFSIPLPPGPCTVRWEEGNHGSRKGREITFASWDGTKNFSGLYSTCLSHQPYKANFADEETEDQRGYTMSHKVPQLIRDDSGASPVAQWSRICLQGRRYRRHGLDP